MDHVAAETALMESLDVAHGAWILTSPIQQVDERIELTM